jgi:hypothetical protein
MQAPAPELPSDSAPTEAPVTILEAPDQVEPQIRDAGVEIGVDPAIPEPREDRQPPKRIWDGRPGEYTLVRTVNNGLVIDRRWDKFVDFEAIEARVFDERKHSHAGTLFRGGRVVEAWGGKPARL